MFSLRGFVVLISDEHPHPFHMGVPRRAQNILAVYVVASQLEESCNNDKYWVRVLHTLSQFPSVRLVDFSMLLKKNVEPSTTLK